MPEKTVSQLKSEWTDRQVTADAAVPDLARFRGRVGRVVTVNENGLAIVDFAEGPWYDIPVQHLQLVEKPSA